MESNKRGYRSAASSLFLLLGLTVVAVALLASHLMPSPRPDSAPDLVYAANSAGGISRWDVTTGALVGELVSPGSGGLAAVGGLRFGPDGNLYVGSIDYISGQHKVLRYGGATGAFIDVFVPNGSGGLVGPDALLFAPSGNLCVTSRDTDNVLRYDGASGAFLDVFASGGGLSGPLGLVFGPDGSLYVSSSGTDQVIRFNGSTGASMGVFAAGTNPVPTGVIFTDGELPPSQVAVGSPPAGSTTLALLPIAPNPASRSTSIRFDLPATAEVSLDVYDMLGRCVQSLIERVPFGAGRHRAEWDARDASGKSRPIGYLLHPTGGHGSYPEPKRRDPRCAMRWSGAARRPLTNMPRRSARGSEIYFCRLNGRDLFGDRSRSSPLRGGASWPR